MKRAFLILPAVIATLLLANMSSPAQQPAGAAPGAPDGPGGPRGGGRGGRGGFGFFGPQLPPEEQAEVDRIIGALDAETKAITAANSNLVVATFSSPSDKDKISKANEELTKARAAWAAKASKLFAETQASDKKLSQDAINRLVQMSSGGRGGRGFGFGGPGGPGGRRGGGNPDGGGPRGGPGAPTQ